MTPRLTGVLSPQVFPTVNTAILDIGRPTFFFPRVLYSSLERSSVPPLSGRFSQVRAREGGA